MYKLASIFLGFIVLIGSQGLFGCSEVTISNGSVAVSARSLDFEEFEPFIMSVDPRGLPGISPTDGMGTPFTWTSIYGSVVVCGDTEPLPVAVCDGMNEKGLGAAYLWDENAIYPPPTPNQPVISVCLLTRFFLDTCATVNEALATLPSYRISGIIPNYFGSNSLPIHVTLHDATGDSALIEFISGSVVVTHPISPTNVTTNEPNYATQVANLSNYKYFGGALPLPGDIGSEARFVRLAAFLSTTPNFTQSQDAVSAAVSLIDTVTEPFGAVDTSPAMHFGAPTWWTSIRDNKNLMYYFRTFKSQTFFVDLKKINFASSKVKYRKIDLYRNGYVDDITFFLLLGEDFF
jgi:choloylglycine hydrolase